MWRTHTCGELTTSDVNKNVILCGWVASRRDHGGVIFLDLRDRYGQTQIVAKPEHKNAFEIADKCKNEFVIKVEGKVVARPKEMVNKKISTGEIEIEATNIQIISPAKTPPFDINRSTPVNEEVRLKYRFLDLRRKRLQNIIILRDKIITYIREYFHKRNFIEIQTPILANSSPEGARDYLVPSRLYPGKFYALPQSPQQFKQLLMIAGFDRYFQIAPCFRDEDPRADRHPGDFYQIDMEMSYVHQEDIWNIIEPLMCELTEKFSNKKIVQKPFPRFTYYEVMSKYGSDKPDLRFNFEIKDVSSVFLKTKFKIFSQVIKAPKSKVQSQRNVIYALKIDKGAKFSRQEIDKLTNLAKENGLSGLAYIVCEKNQLKSPILKFLSKEETEKVLEITQAKPEDIIFFGAGQWKKVCQALGAIRDECGKKLGKKDSRKCAWLWIYDFPMYEYNEKENKIEFSHNPFSMPKGGLSALNTKNPLEILAYQFDIVCNGYEISSGALRNYDVETMYRAFEIVGYTRQEVNKKFGHMISAFQYGAPPHGGCAPGLDRLLMILLDCESIRDIYAFPKNGKAQDVMLGIPSEVSEKQLKELKIKIEK